MAQLRGNLDTAVSLLKGQDGSPRRFRLLAYTGAEFARWSGKAVLDLQGLKVPDKLPILIDHESDLDHVAGFADKHSLSSEGLVLEGQFTQTNDQAKKLAALSDEGYPLTASVGVNVLRVEELSEGQASRVNGRDVKGPLRIWRETSLFETSFVTSNPADKATTAAALTHQQEQTMTPDEFLKANPAAVQAWRDEAGSALLARLKAFVGEFGDRLSFAVERFLAGDSLEKAQAAEAKLLREEVATLKASKGTVDAKAGAVAKLREAANHPGLGFVPAKEPVSDESLTDEERAEAESRATGVNKDALLHYYKNRRQVMSGTVKRAVSAMNGAGEED